MFCPSFLCASSHLKLPGVGVVATAGVDARGDAVADSADGDGGGLAGRARGGACVLETREVLGRVLHGELFPLRVVSDLGCGGEGARMKGGGVERRGEERLRRKRGGGGRRSRVHTTPRPLPSPPRSTQCMSPSPASLFMGLLLALSLPSLSFAPRHALPHFFDLRNWETQERRGRR